MRAEWSATRVTLYTRPGCSLCDTMRTALERLGYEVTEVNIDDDPELTRRYRFDIPGAGRDDGTIVARHRVSSGPEA